MRYTTLGDGKAVKVLATADYAPARTITTCPHASAIALARALTDTRELLPAALYPVAVHLDGTPIQARRRLLGVFDAAAAGDTALSDDQWRRADELVVAAGAAVRGLPAPVIAGARAELANHLEGFDGVLVPARATSSGYRPGVLNLVISGALTRLGKDWWTSMTRNGLEHADDDPIYPVGEQTVDAPSELYDVLGDLWDSAPCDSDYVSTSIEDLARESGDEHLPYLIVAARLFQAWGAHQYPDLLDQH